MDQIDPECGLVAPKATEAETSWIELVFFEAALIAVAWGLTLMLKMSEDGLIHWFLTGVLVLVVHMVAAAKHEDEKDARFRQR